MLRPALIVTFDISAGRPGRGEERRGRREGRERRGRGEGEGEKRGKGEERERRGMGEERERERKGKGRRETGTWCSWQGGGEGSR
jgi:hypothetical protein